MADFFTPLRLEDDYNLSFGAPPAQPSATERELGPYTIRDGVIPGTLGTTWSRDTLFDGSRGEIGLAWSIFKIFGTPTDESWPVSDPSFFINKPQLTRDQSDVQRSSPLPKG